MMTGERRFFIELVSAHPLHTDRDCDESCTCSFSHYQKTGESQCELLLGVATCFGCDDETAKRYGKWNVNGKIQTRPVCEACASDLTTAAPQEVA